MKKIKSMIVGILIVALLAALAVFPLAACDGPDTNNGGGGGGGPVAGQTVQRIEDLIEEMLGSFLPGVDLEMVNQMVEVVLGDDLVSTFVGLLNDSGFNNAQVNRLLDFVEGLEDLLPDFDEDEDVDDMSMFFVMMEIASASAGLNIPNATIAAFYWETIMLAYNVLDRVLEIFGDEFDSYELEDINMVIEMIGMFKEFGRSEFIASYALLLDIQSVLSNSVINNMETILTASDISRAVIRTMTTSIRNDMIAILNLLDNNGIQRIVNLFRLQLSFMPEDEYINISAIDTMLDAFVADWRYLRNSLLAMANALNNTIADAIYDTIVGVENEVFSYRQAQDRFIIISARVFNAGLTANNGINYTRARTLLASYRAIFADLLDHPADLADMNEWFDEMEYLVPYLFNDTAAIAALGFNASLDAFEENAFVISMRMLFDEIGEVIGEQEVYLI